MIDQHKQLLRDLDDLMIALNKQKKVGLVPEVIQALKGLARSRNKFKRMINVELTKKPARQQTVFTCLLDKVADETVSCR